MDDLYSGAWVEAQVARTIEQWNLCALPSIPTGERYSRAEHRKHEKAYDKGLRSVQREARRIARSAADRLKAQQRIVALFPPFASTALDLGDEEVELITASFLPIGTELAQWARAFDATLGNQGIVQACRNAWSCCGMQALLGQPMELTPSILAYSLLYPYSDNYLDHPGLTRADKLQFSERFRQRLRGGPVAPANAHEAAVWTMVELIEQQYPRRAYPQVFDSLLAIHRAQEESLAQLNGCRPKGPPHRSLDDAELLRISCAKGGTSVLADACLTQPLLSEDEIQFAFDWGVLLQLGDDLQDVREDLRRGSTTLFTRAIAEGKPLDTLIVQLLHFSHRIADRMDRMPNGSASLKRLLRRSWRSLILMAVADVHLFCSPAFLAELEPCSSFRFRFLRERNGSLDGRQGLYDTLFDAYIDAGEGQRSGPPLPHRSLPQPFTVPLPAFAHGEAI